MQIIKIYILYPDSSLKIYKAYSIVYSILSDFWNSVFWFYWMKISLPDNDLSVIGWRNHLGNLVSDSFCKTLNSIALIIFSTGVSHLCNRKFFVGFPLFCMFFHAFPLYSHTGEIYPLERNIVQWSKHCKMHLKGKYKDNQDVHAEVTNIDVGVYLWEKSQNRIDSKTVVFIWLKFFKFLSCRNFHREFQSLISQFSP